MSRGRPKPKLRDLSRAKPTEEDYEKWRLTLLHQHPMVCAIWGASMVEHELEDIIRKRLKRNDDSTWAKLTERNGPLASFAGKIDLAYAMGIYDETTKSNLNSIREIRNVFAHAKKPLDFDDELILSELRNLAMPKQPGFKRSIGYIKSVQRKGGSVAFATLCLAMNTQFLRIQTKSLKAKAARMQVRLNKARGWGLWQNLLMQPQAGLGSLQQSFPHDQSGDPSLLVPKGLAGALRPFLDDNET